MRRSHGLTLIELMVALAVFAVLGLLSYRALAHMSAHKALIATERQRWRAIGRTLQRVETELLQIAAPMPGASASTLQLSRSPKHGCELELQTLEGGGPGLRRTSFRFADGKLDSLRWSGREGHGEATSDLLLDRVGAVRWRFLYEGRLMEAWPPDNAGTAVLPQAIELELELPDAGILTRLVALR